MVDKAVIMLIELRRLRDLSVKLVHSQILPMLKKLEPNTDMQEVQLDESQLMEAFEEAWRPLEEVHIPMLRDIILKYLSAEANDGLRQIKSIPAQYRRTNRDKPTQASYFVPQILACISSFRNRWDAFISDAIRRDLIVRVSEDITLKFVFRWVFILICL
jgi:hypothetical protein